MGEGIGGGTGSGFGALDLASETAALVLAARVGEKVHRVRYATFCPKLVFASAAGCGLHYLRKDDKG